MQAMIIDGPQQGRRSADGRPEDNRAMGRDCLFVFGDEIVEQIGAVGGMP
jgi:hypothetical protein